MDTMGRNDNNLYTCISNGVGKNVDAPSKEKLIGTRPSFRIGSEGIVAFSDNIIPMELDSAVTVAGMMLLKYLIDGMLPIGTFDKDKSMDNFDVEFLGMEKG
jgi:hypothetical protein